MENNRSNDNNKNNGAFLIILLIIVTIIVLFFPKINSFIISLHMPKVENVDNGNDREEEKKEIDESILETIHYPLMRNSIYSQNTYYSLDKFELKDMSNSDILLNAFLDIYEGNITSYNGYASCTNSPKQFKDEYLKLRIKNILGNNINYTFENFYVPDDLDTMYPGNWNYDSASKSYIYNGLCSSNSSNTKYYDIKQLIKMEYQNDDIVVYYYVGFAKVENNNYIIYKDANYSEELTNGNFASVENLNKVFEDLKNKNKKIYKFTFKNTLCSYNEYCLYKGEYINEL